ncbi:MAG: alkaline phosphatase family protein, partial [Gimesia sp.]
MRHKIVSFILVVPFLLSLGLVADAGEAHDDRCVILVSVDGLANFYLDDPLADMPTLKKLAKEGARVDGLVCS